MPDWLTVIVIVAMLAERAWALVTDKRSTEALLASFAEERRNFLNRLEAKTVAEYAVMERVGAPKAKKEPAENGLKPGEHPVGL